MSVVWPSGHYSPKGECVAGDGARICRFSTTTVIAANLQHVVYPSLGIKARLRDEKETMSKVEFSKYGNTPELTSIIDDWWNSGLGYGVRLHLPGDGYTRKRAEYESFGIHTVIKGRARIALRSYIQSIVLEPGDEVSTRRLLQRIAISSGVTVILSGQERSSGDARSWQQIETDALRDELSEAEPGSLNCRLVTKNVLPATQDFEAISDAWWERGYDCDFFAFPKEMRIGPEFSNFGSDDTLHAVVKGCLRCEVHTDEVERFDLEPGDEAKVPSYYFKQPVSVGEEPAVWTVGWPRRWSDLGAWLDEYHKLRQHPVSGELLHPRIAGLSSNYVTNCSDRDVLDELSALLTYNESFAGSEMDGYTIQSPLLKLVEQRLQDL